MIYARPALEILGLRWSLWRQQMNVRRAFDRLHTPRTPGIQDGQISRYSRNSRNDAGHAVFRGFTVCTIVVFSAAGADAHIPVGAKLHQEVDGIQFDLRSKRYSGVIRLRGVKSMRMRGCWHKGQSNMHRMAAPRYFKATANPGLLQRFSTQHRFPTGLPGYRLSCWANVHASRPNSFGH